MFLSLHLHHCWLSSFQISNISTSYFHYFLQVKLPYEPVCPSDGLLVCRSIFIYFIIGLEVSLPFSYRSTCYIRRLNNLLNTQGLSSAVDSSSVVYTEKVKPTLKELASQYKKVNYSRINLQGCRKKIHSPKRCITIFYKILTILERIDFMQVFCNLLFDAENRLFSNHKI